MFSSCIFHKEAHNGCVNGSNLIDTFTRRPSCHQFCMVTAWPGSLGRLVISKHTHSSGQPWNKVNLEQVASQKAKWGIPRDLNEDDLHGSQGEPQLVKQGGVGRWDTEKTGNKTPFIALLLQQSCLTSVSFLFCFYDLQLINIAPGIWLCLSLHTYVYWYTHTHTIHDIQNKLPKTCYLKCLIQCN